MQSILQVWKSKVKSIYHVPSEVHLGVYRID